MSWVALGTIQMSFDWQFLNDNPIYSYELIRLTHSFNRQDANRGIVAQAFGDTPPYNFVGYRKIYQSTNIVTLEMPIPKQLKVNVAFVRRIAFKLSSYYSRSFVDDWQIIVEGFTASNVTHPSLENIQGKLLEISANVQSLENDVLNLENKLAIVESKIDYLSGIQ